MYTVEQKVNLLLEYITTTDIYKKAELYGKLLEMAKAPTVAATVKEENQSLYDVIDGLLKDFGIPCNLSGREILHHAIYLGVVDSSYVKLGNITRKLYPTLDAYFGLNKNCAERGMRHAIAVGFERADIRTIEKIVGCTYSLNKDRPTNSEFLAICVDEVKSRCRKQNITY